MSRALDCAQLARGRTRPNPMVGCVVARDGQVLATGYHHRAGEAHGEIDALRKLDRSVTTGADLYVNLEPCSTHGRTPPCTDAIIEAGIRRVFLATRDTNPRHSGAGVDALRAAGIEVIEGVCEPLARRLNAPYFRTMELGRPLVAAKWAMSLDGKIATHDLDSAWITNESSREYVHRLRNEYDAVLVGYRTLMHDDPRLTCRLEGGRDPLRVVIDPRLEAPATHRVFELAGTIVAHRDDAKGATTYADDRSTLMLPLPPSPDGRLPIDQLIAALHSLEVMSVLVEGGGELLGSLFDGGLVDRVYAFVAPRVVGGRDAVSAVGGRGVPDIATSMDLENIEIQRFGNDMLVAGDLAGCLPDL